MFWYECSSGSDDAVTLCYDSQDGESGFPGSVRASVTFTLNSKNELRIKYNADATNKPTPINMANHAYFNLAGHVNTFFFAFDYIKKHFQNNFMTKPSIHLIKQVVNSDCKKFWLLHFINEYRFTLINKKNPNEYLILN